MVVLLLAGNAVSGSAQSDASLAALTVPATALPAGCVLEPVVDPAEQTLSGGVTLRLWPATAAVFPSNPWAGDDSRLVPAVRLVIDPVPVARPDGQVIASSSGTRSDEVREAYRAVYAGADGSRTYVTGVRFDDESSVRPEPVSAMTNPPRGLNRRFTRDATVVRVSATAPDACTRAIVAHVQSLM